MDTIRPRTYSHKQIYQLLGISARRFRRHRRKMEEAGFPKTLPGLPNVFPADQVDAYVRGNGIASEDEEKKRRWRDARNQDPDT